MGKIANVSKRIHSAVNAYKDHTLEGCETYQLQQCRGPVDIQVT